MDQWEYRTESEYLGEWKLNKIGAEGWELVGFTSTAGSGMFPKTDYRYVFKRRIK